MKDDRDPKQLGQLIIDRPKGVTATQAADNIEASKNGVKRDPTGLRHAV